MEPPLVICSLCWCEGALRRAGSHPPAASRVGRSSARDRERQYGGERGALRSHSCPTVAAVAALPELPVGEAREEATVGREECVGHRRQRLGQPARERLPGFAVAAPV